MDELPNAKELADRLRRSALRGFCDDVESAGERPWGREGTWVEVPYSDCPIPSVLRLALGLIGIAAYGPSEKVAWWVPFTYAGRRFQLAHQKFGLRLRLIDDNVGEEEAQVALHRTQGKLLSAMRVVEKAIKSSAKKFVEHGDATVLNQHSRLQSAYVYFRDRALNPEIVEDETTTLGLMQEQVTVLVRPRGPVLGS